MQVPIESEISDGLRLFHAKVFAPIICAPTVTLKDPNGFLFAFIPQVSPCRLNNLHQSRNMQTILALRHDSSADVKADFSSFTTDVAVLSTADQTIV